MRWDSAPTVKRVVLAGGLVALVALAVVVFLAPSLYEVQDKGRNVVPYESGVVYKVRVLDEFNLYASEESRPEADKLSGFGLVAAATMMFMALLLLNAVRASPHLRRFYMFGAAGLAFLAADEIFGLHETLGHNLQFLADLPEVERPDDLIFSLYVIPAALFAWYFRDILVAHRNAVRFFAVGIFFAVVAAVGDLTGSGVDELAEVITAFCLLAGLVALTVTTLRQELDLDRTAASRFDGLRQPAGGSRTGVASDLSLPAQPTP